MVATSGLGWRHVPGTFSYIDSVAEPPRKFSVTYLSDYSRITSLKGELDNTPLALTGCSFIEGFGLDDVDTAGWKLQTALPGYSVQNFGTGGYGTYQSLLAIKALPERFRTSPGAVILYGFADFHAARNIRSSGGQRAWSDEAIFPVCDLNGCGVWSGKRMEGWLRRSRAISLLENIVDLVGSVWNSGTARKVTERLVAEMQGTVRAMGARLIIAPVTEIDSEWAAFFRSINAEVVLCAPSIVDPKTYLLGDGHPNARWNEDYSRCIARYLTEHP
jgi:hypothetical protein